LLIDGFARPPALMMTYNPPSYPRLIEGAGYRKAKDLYAYISPVHGASLRRLQRLAERTRERNPGLTTRGANLAEFDGEVRLVQDIYNAAWEKNWGFVPPTEAEAEHIAHAMKSMIDPNLIWFAEKDGEAIGSLFPLPDLNQALIKAYPRPGVPEWWTLAKFLWHWKVRRCVNIMRGFAGGVLEERRSLGVIAVLMVKLAEVAIPRYRWCELSWILENNIKTRQICEMLGGKVYRTYRVYEKTL